MSLTLVQLAQAITDGKTLETYNKILEVWGGPGKTDIGLMDLWFAHPDRVRIKPEPREYWMLGDLHLLSLKDAQIERAKGRYEEIIHVKEVI